MRGINHFILLLLLIGSISCEKKKYPESVVENDAVFFMQANINYNAVKLAAGENNYYMYSSYLLDPNNVRNFSGTFRQLNCSDCRNTMEIRIRDSKPIQIGVPGSVDSALHTGFYPFIEMSTDMTYSVTFQGSHTSPGKENVQWSFGDGSKSTELNPTHIYQMPGKYNVCLTVQNENGCQGSVCNEINLNPDGCIASVRSATVGDRSVQFSVDMMRGRSPYKYLWNFGDGTISTNAAPLHQYLHDGSYPVMLTVTDANNQTSVTRHHVVTNKDVYSCVPNMKVTSLSTTAKINTGGIFVTWTDQNGITYYSDKTAQIATSYFEITKVEDYGLNENGQKTKKLHVRFSCVLSDGHRAIPVENAESVICVAVQ
jgi:PKD repeat protein